MRRTLEDANRFSLSQTKSYLSRLGLQGVEQTEKAELNAGAVWVTVQAKLPVGKNPTADWHALQDRVKASMRPDPTRPTLESSPKEAFTYADGSLTVIHGNVRTRVLVTEAAAASVVPLQQPAPMHRVNRGPGAARA